MIYLDNNAAALPLPSVCQAVTSAMHTPANPMPLHSHARAAFLILEQARETLKKYLDAADYEVIFTSGSTEGNNFVINAFDWQNIALARIEHASLLQPASRRNIIELYVSENGLVQPDSLPTNACEAPTLVSLMLANHETGVIQPVRELAALARQSGAVMHSDISQAIGKMPRFSVSDLGLDIATVNFHKCGGPCGIGAVLFRSGMKPNPMMFGGGQELGLRPGTHNISAIAGVQALLEAMPDVERMYADLASLRAQLEAALRASGKSITFFGQDSERLTNTACFAVHGISNQILAMQLDLHGISVGTGSACAADSSKASAVLRAMHVPEEVARSAIRISMGWHTTASDIQAAIEFFNR